MRERAVYAQSGYISACTLMSARLRTFSRTVETDGEHALSHEGLSAVLMQWLPWLRAASAASQRADAPPAHNVPTVTSVHRRASRAGGGLPLMVMGWV